MSDGDAVETARKAMFPSYVFLDVEGGRDEILEQQRATVIRGIQALVDGGHYVTQAEHRAALDHLGIVANDLRREQDKVQARRAERDAAITRAETAEALHRYLEDRANDARCALAEAEELLRRLAAVVRCIDVSDDGELDDSAIAALADYDAFLTVEQ